MRGKFRNILNRHSPPCEMNRTESTYIVLFGTGSSSDLEHVTSRIKSSIMNHCSFDKISVVKTNEVFSSMMIINRDFTQRCDNAYYMKLIQYKLHSNDSQFVDVTVLPDGAVIVTFIQVMKLTKTND